MKKKSLCLIVATLFLSVLVASCDACGSAGAAFAAKKPWDDLVRLYERCEYDIAEYSVKEESGESGGDKKLAEGKLVLTLSDGLEGHAVLDMRAEMTYLDVEENGSDRGLTDVLESKVTFDKVTMIPVSSVKTATLADRLNAINDSYSLDVDYANDVEKLTFRGETKERATGTRRQAFDNEQLFYLVRAFAALGLSGSQSFPVHVGLDAFNYDIASYTMTMSVNSAPQKVKLDGWKNENVYGLETEDSRPVADCYNVSIAINSSASGTPINALYSTVPFAVTPNISTEKVLMSFSTSRYVNGASDARRTVYTLSDYNALTTGN